MLAAAAFTFGACSSDDNNEGQKTNTYQYSVFVSDFEGTSDQMDEINNAFDEQLGKSVDGLYSLSGTQEECNRKVTELSYKAGSKFADQEDFKATIEVCNISTDSTIYKKTIDAGNNGVTQAGSIWITSDKSNIILTNLEGKKAKLVSVANRKVVFDNTVDSNKEKINVNRGANGRFFVVTIESKDKYQVILQK